MMMCSMMQISVLHTTSMLKYAYNFDQISSSQVLNVLEKCEIFGKQRNLLDCIRQCPHPCRAFGYGKESGQCEVCNLKGDVAISWATELLAPAPGVLYYYGK